jgi:hypothetical protein
MSYLVNTARLSSLLIGGVNYTSNLISWTASDSSANKNGFVKTQGQLVLGENAAGQDLEDYDRNLFRRGVSVILNITDPSTGTVKRHPRGLLYVISTGYDAQSSSLSVEIGCRLTLATISDDNSVVLPLVPIPLEEDRQDLNNCGASFSTAGKCLYQDNNGALVSRTFFQGDGLGTAAAGEWVSIIGRTALSASPLLGGSALPDSLLLSYQSLDLGGLLNIQDKRDINITESDYFLTYPAFKYQRKTPGISDLGTSTVVPAPAVPETSACGNNPPEPAQNPDSTSCTDGYETTEESVTVNAKSLEKQETYYKGPAGQVSYVYQEKNGLPVELNGQYFSDLFAYCRYQNSKTCSPNGYCPYYGTTFNTKQSYQETFNTYGSGGELVKTVQDSYENILTAAQTTDWRAGSVDGETQSFIEINYNQRFYRSQSVVTEYKYSQSGNTTETTTYKSIASNNVGINAGNLDALAGIKTFQRNTSTTISSTPIAPDRIETPQKPVKENKIEVPLFAGSYVEPPVESGPFVIKEQVPIPLVSLDGAAVSSTVAIYSNYLVRFLKGDALGYSVSESMRKEVLDGWYPGMPFYLCDQEKDKILSLRMDGTVWGVSQDQCIFTTGGIWIGDSNGTLVLPDNIVGNSTPDIEEGEPVPPVGPGDEPEVTDGTSVNSGVIAFVITVNFSCGIDFNFAGNNSIISTPSDIIVDIFETFIININAFTVEPGNLLSVDAYGGMPLEYNGSLITGNATIVDANLFEA